MAAEIAIEYWADRMRDHGIPTLIIQMTLLAIADALAPPIICDQTSTRSQIRRSVDRAVDRWTACRWLFNDYEDEYNFASVCNAAGFDVRHARETIISMWMEGVTVPAFHGGPRPNRRILTGSSLEGDNSDWRKVMAANGSDKGATGKATKANPMGGVGTNVKFSNTVVDNAGKAGSYSIRGGGKKGK